MRRWLLRALLASALVALGVWLWTVLFPSPDRIIRKNLTELAKSVSFGRNESPVAILANASRVAGFFTADVEIRVDVPGGSAQVINGRQELFQITQRVRSLSGGLQVQLLDINLAVAADKKSAEANLTLRGKVAGERDMIVQELKLLLNKLEGRWKIQRVETVKTLSRAPTMNLENAKLTF